MTLGKSVYTDKSSTIVRHRDALWIRIIEVVYSGKRKDGWGIEELSSGLSMTYFRLNKRFRKLINRIYEVTPELIREEWRGGKVYIYATKTGWSPHRAKRRVKSRIKNRC